METKVLVMTFINTLKNKFSISIADPKDTVTEEEIATTMNLILQKQIFQPKGYQLAECVGARIVEQIVTEYDLEI